MQLVPPLHPSALTGYRRKLNPSREPKQLISLSDFLSRLISFLPAIDAYSEAYSGVSLSSASVCLSVNLTVSPHTILSRPYYIHTYILHTYTIGPAHN